MKKIFFSVGMLVLLFTAGCRAPVTELKIEKGSSGSGFLFIDAIDGVRTKNEEIFILKPGQHKIVYSYSEMSGLFAPPREKFYVVTVDLPKQIKYEFTMFTDLFDGNKRKFVIRQAGGGLFVEVVKQWTEAELEPFQF